MVSAGSSLSTDSARCGGCGFGCIAPLQCHTSGCPSPCIHVGACFELTHAPATSCTLASARSQHLDFVSTSRPRASLSRVGLALPLYIHSLHELRPFTVALVAARAILPFLNIPLLSSVSIVLCSSAYHAPFPVTLPSCPADLLQ